MKLEEQEAKYIIKYNHKDIDSIRKALKEYSQLVISGDAFDDSYCVAHFLPESSDILTSYFADREDVLVFLNNSTYYSKSDSESVNLCDSILSETLFFMCAAMYPQLELDMKHACEAIVSYARRINDSSYMWITCEMPFGVEPLLVTSNVYPSYAYLLAAFYVPYWDDEHMPEALFELSQLTYREGINENTIKAFCYCDNSRARENVLGYDSWDGTAGLKSIQSNFNLIEYLREDNDRFTSFKLALAQRFKQQPFLQTYSDGDSYNSNPIRSIVVDIMMLEYPYDSWDDDLDMDEYLTQRFIISSAEEEIIEITQFIEDYLQTSIVPSKRDYIALQKKMEKENIPEEENIFNVWASFIKTIYFNGDDIWHYVLTGENYDLLEQLEGVDLYRLSRRRSSVLYDIMNKYIDCYEDINSELHNILSSLFSYLFSKQNIANTDSNTPCTDTNKQIALRFIDLVFIMCSKQAFSNDFIRMMSVDYSLCTIEELHNRYIVCWKTNLKQILSDYSRYMSEMNKSKLELCLQIINENRVDARKSLPTDLLSIEDTILNASDEEDDFDFLNSRQGYNKIDSLLLAVYLCYIDSQSGTSDSLTIAAKKYVDKYAVQEIILDLFDSCDFPKQSTMDLINKGAPAHFDNNYIDNCKKTNIQKLRIEKYIQKGYFSSTEFVSDSVLHNEALEILNSHLEFDKHNISPSQKQVAWLGGFSDNTDKLFVLMHLGVQMRNLSCSNALQRILSLSFSLAPIRVCHIISKYYMDDRYCFDNIDYMLNSLGRFKSQSLPLSGYWGYQMGLFAGRSDIEDLKYYHSLLSEYLNSTSVVADGFMTNSTRENKIALNKGISLLSCSTQLCIINDAKLMFPEKDLTDSYDKLFLERIKRELSQEFKIEDLPIYFKNKLAKKNIYHEFVEWNNWNDNQDLLNEILSSVVVDKAPDILDENYVEQVQRKKGWGYIVVQRKNDKLVPVYGHDLLYLIQRGFDIKNIYSAQTNLIIIDETCPAEFIDELMALSEKNYRAEWIKKIIKYIIGDSMLSDVEYILSCGIRKYQFLHNDYNDISVNDIIMKVNPTIRLFTLRAIALVSYEALDLVSEMSVNEYFAMLMKYRVDYRAVFKFLIGKQKYTLMPQLAEKVDISPFISKEKINIKINILAHIASMPQYHPLILSMENSKSAKLKKYISMLIDKFNIKAKHSIRFSIVDYGVYVMESTRTLSSKNKEVSEPYCINKTSQIKAEIGMYFGLRFTADKKQADIPAVTVHNVVVKHPLRNSEGVIIESSSSWQQNGYSESNIFMGWYFDPADELLSGNYNITAHDTDGNLLVEMCFVVG